MGRRSSLIVLSGGAELRGSDHFECYFLDILGGGGKKTLSFDTDEASEPRISMSVELFGVGEGALDGFLSSLVDFLAVRRETVFVDGIAVVLPKVAIKFALVVLGTGA